MALSRPFNLRLPAGLRDKLLLLAQARDTTLTAEIIAALHAHVRDEPLLAPPPAARGRPKKPFIHNAGPGGEKSSAVGNVDPYRLYAGNRLEINRSISYTTIIPGGVDPRPQGDPPIPLGSTPDHPEGWTTAGILAAIDAAEEAGLFTADEREAWQRRTWADHIELCRRSHREPQEFPEWPRWRPDPVDDGLNELDGIAL